MPGANTKRRGIGCLSPSRGGGERNHIAGKWGAGGRGGGIASGAFRPLDDGDPQVGDRDGPTAASGTPKAIKTELKGGGRAWCGSRVGTVGTTPCGPILGKLGNIITKEAKRGGSR